MATLYDDVPYVAILSYEMVKENKMEPKCEHSECPVAEALAISEFGEDEIPSFRQGPPEHVLEELVTAARCTRLVNKITTLYSDMKILQNYAQHLKGCASSKLRQSPTTLDDSIFADCDCGLDKVTGKLNGN